MSFVTSGSCLGAIRHPFKRVLCVHFYEDILHSAVSILRRKPLYKAEASKLSAAPPGRKRMLNPLSPLNSKARMS